MGSLTCALRDGRLSFIGGGEVANAITPADTKIAPAHNDAPAGGASALARTVAESTIAANRIVVKTKLSRTLDEATTRAHAWRSVWHSTWGFGFQAHKCQIDAADQPTIETQHRNESLTHRRRPIGHIRLFFFCPNLAQISSKTRRNCGALAELSHELDASKRSA